MFKPTSTFSSFDKSPIILRIGSGTLRTKVGTAKIWSPSASCGLINRSITSILYSPSKYSSQYLCMLASSVCDLAVLPAIYNLNSYLHSFVFMLFFAVSYGSFLATPTPFQHLIAVGLSYIFHQLFLNINFIEL